MTERPLSTCPQCHEVLSVSGTGKDGKDHPFCPQCKFPLMLIAGKYRLESVIAEGGYGIVYRARHILLTQQPWRVVKVLRPDVLKIESIRQRFQREVELTAELSRRNEHIVRIYDDFGVIPNLGPFYVMEYLEGTRLDLWLSAGTQLPPVAVCLELFGQLCSTIHFAHECGVLHRDLKPENLMVLERPDQQHFLKVLDFGIAKPLNATELRESQHLTQGIVGTPYYMSPEQCANHPVDARSDVYALGCILFQMLTGFPPFAPLHPQDAPPSPVDLYRAHLSQPPPSARRVAPQRVSSDMDEVIQRALAKHPAERYVSVKQFAEDVRFFAKEYNTEARSQTTQDFSSTALPSGVGWMQPPQPEPSTHPIQRGPTRSPVPLQPTRLPDQAQPMRPSVQAQPTLSPAQSPLPPLSSRPQATMHHPEIASYWQRIRRWGLLLLCGVSLAVGVWVFRWWNTPSSTKSQTISRTVSSTMPQTTVSSLVRTMSPTESRMESRRGDSKAVGAKIAVASKAETLVHPSVSLIQEAKTPEQRQIKRRRTRYIRKNGAIQTHSPKPRRSGETPDQSRSGGVIRRVAAGPRVAEQRPGSRVTHIVPVRGCPEAETAWRWVRLDYLSDDTGIRIAFLTGKGVVLSRKKGVCLKIGGPVQIQIDGPERRPCVVSLPFRHASYRIRLQEESLHEIEVKQNYCIP